jgi:hypothetical protein
MRAEVTHTNIPVNRLVSFAEAYMAELTEVTLKFPTHVEIFVLEKDYPTFDPRPRRSPRSG